MKPILSIIIPCYNSENTLEDTLVSVYEQEHDSWEAIIVNDGSPDNLEEIALKWVKKDQRFKYFRKENGGLGTARNYGVEQSSGSYILPLDSDNMVRPDFFRKALKIFQSNENIGVVYGNAMYFGEKTGLWEVGSFDRIKVMAHNYIDACAIIRKKVYYDVGLYDTNMPFQGHEDWEFWLRVIKSNYQFHYLNEVTFNYRITGDSMIRQFDHNMMADNAIYIKKKHFDLYMNTFDFLYKENINLNRELNKSIVERIIRKLKPNRAGKYDKDLTNSPLVSVCIPTYNGAEYLQETLDSVRNQTYKNIEVIVSDDASKDNTLQLVKAFKKEVDFPVYLYEHKPKGIGANWNNTVRKSNGKYIKFLFQDDILHDDCIEKMLDMALRNPSAGMIYSKRDIIFDTNREDYKIWLGFGEHLHLKWGDFVENHGIRKGKEYLKDSNFYPSDNKIGEPVAVLLKRECFDRVGYFNNDLKQTLDFEYWYRLMKHYDIGFYNEKLVKFRLHKNQATQINKMEGLKEERKLKRIYLRKFFWHVNFKTKIKLLLEMTWFGIYLRRFYRLITFKKKPKQKA